jgi:uncharacterized protein YkwD
VGAPAGEAEVTSSPRSGPYAGRMRAWPALCLCVALGIASLLAGCTPSPPGLPPLDGEADATAARLLELVNDARAATRGCGALGWHDAAAPLALEQRLGRAAQLHSDDMRATGAMSHVGSDGSTLRQRVDRQGYPWVALGENVGRGYATPESVVNAWLASDGHCANVMDAGFSQLGAGESGRFWTLVFARPR